MVRKVDADLVIIKLSPLSFLTTSGYQSYGDAQA